MSRLRDFTRFDDKTPYRLVIEAQTQDQTFIQNTQAIPFSLVYLETLYREHNKEVDKISRRTLQNKDSIVWIHIAIIFKCGSVTTYGLYI